MPTNDNKPVRIVRAPHSEYPYFLMCRALAQDRTLTWAARGVLTYLLSKPDDWMVQPTDLEQKCGRDKVYAMLKELIAARYIERVILRDAEGKVVAWEYRVHENPYNPLPENPDLAQPDLANPDSTDYRSEQNTDSFVADDPATVDTLSEPESESENAILTESSGESPLQSSAKVPPVADYQAHYMELQPLPTKDWTWAADKTKNVWHISDGQKSLCRVVKRGNLRVGAAITGVICQQCVEIAKNGPQGPQFERPATDTPATKKRRKRDESHASGSALEGPDADAPKPRKPQPSDPAFDAMCAGYAGVLTCSAADREAWGWTVGQTLYGDARGKRASGAPKFTGIVAYECVRLGVDRDALDWHALAADVTRFWELLRTRHADLDFSQAETICKWWAKYRVAEAGGTIGGQPDYVEAPDMPGVMIKRSDLESRQRAAQEA